MLRYKQDAGELFVIEHIIDGTGKLLELLLCLLHRLCRNRSRRSRCRALHLRFCLHLACLMKLLANEGIGPCLKHALLLPVAYGTLDIAVGQIQGIRRIRHRKLLSLMPKHQQIYFYIIPVRRSQILIQKIVRNTGRMYRKVINNICAHLNYPVLSTFRDTEIYS